MKILDTKTATMAEALDILKNENEDNLGYEQKITLEYLHRHTLLSKKDVVVARAELEKIEGLKEHQITALLDLLPEKEEEVKIIFMKERITLETAQIKKVLEAIDKIRPDKKKIKAKRTPIKKKEEPKETVEETEK
ncbi:MAG: hypothetical protein KAI53_04090 [Candidatus Aenigmarchaeota archaeon]|nr:hypothetical protein [Candidatus Aenigmarchaeota archaeon]